MILRIPYTLVQWTLCIVVKLFLTILGLIIVPIALRFEIWPRVFWLWANEEDPRSPLSRISDFWWLAVRNPVNNLRFLFNEPTFKSKGYKGDLEKAPGFAWVFKYSRFMDGLRIVWGPPSNKGKKEFYIGWKLGSPVPGLGFTLQFRPF